MRLLLDAHVPPRVAHQLVRHGVDAVALQEWGGGVHRHASDDILIQAAFEDVRVLVTYDLRTIPSLLMEWAETGHHHGGVILVDDKTIRPDNIGGLVRALRAVAGSGRTESWLDRVVFLAAE